MRTMRQNALRAMQSTLRSGKHTEEQRRGRNKARQEHRRRKRMKKARPMVTQHKAKTHNWKAITRPRWTNSRDKRKNVVPQHRPRVATTVTRLISESAQAADLAEGSEWDAIHWRTSMLLHVTSSILLSKPKRQKQNEGDDKDEMKDRNQTKILKEIRKTLQLAPPLISRMEDSTRSAKKARKEEDTGDGSQRARDQQNATSRARQHQRSMPSTGRKRPCTKQPGHGRKKSRPTDVTRDEHKELENARKEANTMRSKVPEMTTGAVRRRIRVLKAGAAQGPAD